MMEKTLVILKPCTLQRGLVGEIINRFERKGLRTLRSFEFKAVLSASERCNDGLSCYCMLL